MAKPVAERPYIAHEEYGVPKHTRGLLEWSAVAERFASEQNFWVCTISPEGHPHVRPVWGVFADDSICFGGGPETRWSRNLKANPNVSVHLESGTKVVVAEGSIDRIEDGADPRYAAVDKAYNAKYKMGHPPPIWIMKPATVIAWTEFPKDATRFRF
jgi:hypothetical protein